MVNTSRDAWKNRLIDLSRRNNLLFYRPLVNGALELPIGQELIRFLSSGNSIAVAELVPGQQFAAANIRTIARKGLENLEEKGLSTLYLAVGRCSWTAEDGGRDSFAPILLFPVTLKFKGHDVQSTEVETTGKPEVNPVLIHVLNEELNVRITGEELLHKFRPEPEEGDDDSDEAEIDLQGVLDLFASRAKKVPGFTAQPFAVIGNFSFQKLAMVKDLELRGAELISNDIVAAIAGDASARRAMSASNVDVDPKGLDSVPPTNEFAVMEADSSQQCAISGIVAGQSAVVHGPPGTGKSQTITNLIATLAATGKKVLFVAEKRAALEVVMNRLTSVGLDHLAIDLHGAELAPKKVMENVARTLNMVRDAGLPAVDDVHNAFVDRRNKLNQHDQRMHKLHAPTGMSIFQMQGHLLRLPSDISNPVRWRSADLNAITSESANQIRDLLREAAGFVSLLNRTDPSPWCGVELEDTRAAQNALDLLSRVAHEELPSLIAGLTQICADFTLRMPTTIDDAATYLREAIAGNEILSCYQQSIFPDAQGRADAMVPGCAPGLKSLWVRISNARLKKAYRDALLLRTAGRTSVKQVWEEMKSAAGAFDFWQKWGENGKSPVQIPTADSCKQIFDKVSSSLNEAERISSLQLKQLPLTELLVEVRSLAQDTATPYRISRVCEIERKLKRLGVQKLVDEIHASRRPAAQWVSAFDYSWLTSTLDMAALADPDVRAFVGSTHNGYVDSFRTLDEKRLDLAAARVRRAHAEHAVAAMNKYPEQESIIRSEAAKSRRHKPLRKVFTESANVLTAVCPCWMASPLSVCQLIGATGIFDYVIFDEASQILPEDAIPSILRGKHVIVAGDNKQLPPTTFFAAADEEDDSDADSTGYESLLDMMIPFVKGFHLNWHYRSRDESLIAFSNHHVYDDRLVTFPGPGGGPAISHVYVDHIPASDGQEESSSAEVEKVVQLVLQHARTTPDLSLGVITMGIKHANRIQGAIDRELNGDSELSEFFDTGRPERFFVKNLERVQGDERDVVIISVGYGKDRAGNLPLRFGPILSAGGRRRLNVAATRAKRKVVVVSSFAYSDINSSQVRPGTGLEFLKSYIEYASSGGRLLFNGELTTEPMNDFELDVFEALSSHGLTLVPQLGCSKFRIDFAACHPAAPGKYVLAIECDGATYHSSYTARDRDRLRQQQLERLGWTFHRIWSTDWFLRRDDEIQRAVQAFNRAVEKSNGNGGSAANRTSSEPHTPNSTSVSSKPAVRNSASPPIPVRKSIDEYTSAEMRNLLRWVQSDGRLRTSDELADEMFEALPFARRGSKIEAAIKRAIAQG
ncbi:AAA domain-containing protein [Occallatibacter savannae]|uniref:AAA domain-containing protein n=1 Tax=Occallatibacter savannae TaxID=1002691 RepID=UPI0013A55FF6|nr:AAA domain-containing protein [Occallatibacter savannae]